VKHYGGRMGLVEAILNQQLWKRGDVKTN